MMPVFHEAQKMNTKRQKLDDKIYMWLERRDSAVQMWGRDGYHYANERAYHFMHMAHKLDRLAGVAAKVYEDGYILNPCQCDMCSSEVSA